MTTETYETIAELKTQGLWDSFYISGEGLVAVLNHLPDENLVGVEIGIDKAYTTACLLERCPKIKMLYGIDPWLPYQNWDGMVDLKEVTKAKNTALANLEGYKERCQIIEKSGTEAAQQFEDDSLDFIFIDGDHSYEACMTDFETYWPKMKVGAVFAGHDIGLPGVHKALVDFRNKYVISSQMYSLMNQAWFWIKE